MGPAYHKGFPLCPWESRGVITLESILASFVAFATLSLQRPLTNILNTTKATVGKLGCWGLGGWGLGGWGLVSLNGTPYWENQRLIQILGGGFKYFVFSPLFGEDSQFD